MIQKRSSTDPKDAKMAIPATSLLKSTERVTNVLASTLSKDKDTFTISRPNIGMCGPNSNDGIVLYKLCIYS